MRTSSPGETTSGPYTVMYAEPPKTSTGKVQKNLLRERARAIAGGR